MNDQLTVDNSPLTANAVPALRFPEFSGEWTKGCLSDCITSLDTGVSVLSSDQPASDVQKGILKTSCVTSGSFTSKENKVVKNNKQIQRLKESVVADTIVISRMNTPALVGANAYIGKSYKNLYLPDRLWAAKISKLHVSKWVSILTSSSQLRSKFSVRATGTSNSMKNITKYDVMSIPINYPSRTEQRKIVSFLTSVDTKIEQLGKKKALLEKYKKGMMQKLFSQALRFKDELGNKFPDWDAEKLKYFCDALSGCPVAGDEILENRTSMPLLRGINISEGYIRHSITYDRYHGGNIKVDFPAFARHFKELKCNSKRGSYEQG